MQYVTFKEGEQRLFMQEVKSRSRKTWKELAQTAQKTLRMMFCYRNEQCLIPLSVFVEFSRFTVGPSTISLTRIQNAPVPCRQPELDETLAEFLGVLAGDGYLGRKPYTVAVVISRLVDREYAKHVKELFFLLFSLSAVVRPENNTLKIRVYSKRLLYYLHQNFRLPIGKKKGNLHIPRFSSPSFIRAYIRGLFDTDGSFYERGSNRGVVNICSRDPVFLQEVSSALQHLGFHPCVSGKDLYLYRRNEIHRFFDEIRPANAKHIEKYKRFSKKTLNI